MTQTANHIKLQVNFQTGELLYEGPNHFLEEQAANTIESILKVLQTNQPIAPSTVGQIEARPFVLHERSPENEEQNKRDLAFESHFGVTREEMESIVDFTDNGFQIISTKIKGSTAEKQVKYSLLYCMVKDYFGEKKVPLDELRALCQHFVCFDPGNFAAHFNRKKELFIVEGQKRSPNKMIKITAPGKAEAKKLIASLVTRRMSEEKLIEPA